MKSLKILLTFISTLLALPFIAPISLLLGLILAADWFYEVISETIS